MGLTRKIGYAAIACPAVLTSSYMAADAHRYDSFNGDDISFNSDNHRDLSTCDRESDSTQTKGIWDLDFGGGGNGSVSDSDGNNGNCFAAQNVGDIKRHQTCETPSFLPDQCGPWVEVRK